MSTKSILTSLVEERTYHFKGVATATRTLSDGALEIHAIILQEKKAEINQLLADKYKLDAFNAAIEKSTTPYQCNQFSMSNYLKNIDSTNIIRCADIYESLAIGVIEELFK